MCTAEVLGSPAVPTVAAPATGLGLFVWLGAASAEDDETAAEAAKPSFGVAAGATAASPGARSTRVPHEAVTSVRASRASTDPPRLTPLGNPALAMACPPPGPKRHDRTVSGP